MSLLLPQHTKLKEQILEVLDADLIRQQAEKGILDFQVSDEAWLLYFVSNCHSSIFCDIYLITSHIVISKMLLFSLCIVFPKLFC
jgi:hypothetical protein